MTAPRTFGARIAACGLAALAAWEIAVVVAAGASAPKPRDWQAAAAAVRASADPEALVVFAPRWIDPVGRRWLGDLISLDQAARMDTARYRQVWEVSIRGATAREVAGEASMSEGSFGPIRVRQFVRSAPTVTWDLRDRSRIHEVDFEPRKGVVLELRRAGEQQRLRVPGVRLGTALHVSAGLADHRARSENRGTALLQVLVDGREVTRGYAGNDSGWLALPVASIQPGRHDVEFVARVHESRGPVRLAVCVAAESRSPR